MPDPNPPTPTPVPPPPLQGINPNFRADAYQINAGQCTTLRWNVENINAVFLIDGGRQEGVGGNDARNGCPGQPTTYVLRVFDRNNIAFDFPLTINVSGAPPPPPPAANPRIIDFGANTNSIQVGQCVNFRWRTENAAGVNLVRSGANLVQGGPREGEHNDCPGQAGYYDYQLTAYGNGGDSRTIGVDVKAAGGGGRPRDE